PLSSTLVYPAPSLTHFSFFFSAPSPTEISTLSLHDALPIFDFDRVDIAIETDDDTLLLISEALEKLAQQDAQCAELVKLRFFVGDRKSTRLNSSHDQISYAVFCLKKKKKKKETKKRQRIEDC